jgi:endonuclease-3
MTPKNRLKLLQIFAENNPHPRSELNFSSDYELITAVMLSAQTTDKKVNEVTTVLFKQYPTPAALAKASLTEVETIIRPLNYYKTKAKNIIATSKLIAETLGGELPRSEEELTKLPGVGRKTANVVLAERGWKPAIAVDTHVFRLAHRLGLSEAKTPDGVEDDLKKQFAKEHWRNLHHWLILHGRYICTARKPLCGKCGIRGVCPKVFL